MSQHAEAPVFASPPVGASLRDSARRVTGDWWISLVAGVAWLAAALVILQFDEASVTTVGILVGIMFTFAGIQNVAAAAVPGSTRAPSIVFAVLLGVAAILCFVDPAPRPRARCSPHCPRAPDAAADLVAARESQQITDFEAPRDGCENRVFPGISRLCATKT